MKTRKIQIALYEVDKEIRNEKYKKLRDIRYNCWKCANEIYRSLYINQQINNDLKDIGKNKEEAGAIIKSLYNSKTFQNIAYNITKKYDEKIPSVIRASLAQNIRLHYDADKKDILCGNRQLRFYKREKFNIYFNIGHGKENFFKVSEDKKDIIFNLTKEFQFILLFGQDRSNNKIIVKRIMEGEYALSDSNIQFKDNKLFLNLCYNQPEVSNILDSNLSVGVDLGISNLAYCALSEGYDRLAIPGKYASDHRQIIQKQYREIQKSLITSKGGRGRKRKLKPLERFHEKEKNFMQTINHGVSREIIKFALKNKAGVIKLEDLSREQFEKYNGEQDESTLWINRNWTYYQLQKMIEYKAKEQGIQIIYVDPTNTSKMCSKCSNVFTDLKLSDRDWICPICGEKHNRDYNAAINIAHSVSLSEKKNKKLIK